MKYKVGDKVRVKSREWYKENKDEDGNVRCNGILFNERMSSYNDKNAVVTRVMPTYYYLDLDDGRFVWSDGMLEGKHDNLNGLSSLYEKKVQADWGELDLSRFKIPEEKIQADLEELNVRTYNVGNSDYSKHKIQPWDIWLEYDLNPWDADIIKRVLRKKEGDSRKLDYEKIIHVCKERIRQIENNGN